jgi:hypothetical protein
VARRRSTLRALFCAGAVVLGVSPARADRITDAEELFRRAKALVAQGRHADACPLFASSYRLDPGTGTLLNLALCHEEIGRVSSAWGEFRAVEQQSRDKPDRAALARAHAEKLEPRLSRLRITAPEALVRAGLVVKVDGEEKPSVLWSGVPVDVGSHVVDASAPSRVARSLDVKVEDEGITVPVSVPELEQQPQASEARAPVDMEAVERVAASRARRTAGFVVGGIGFAAVGTGLAFGVGALVNDADARDTCPAPCVDGSPSAIEADEKTSRAVTFANVSNVTIPIGLVGVAIGVYLVLTSSPSATPVPARAAAPFAVRF